MLDALAVELELFEHAGRLHHALAGASWSALKALSADGSLVQGVVHRDLSPDNILLSWDGAVKIADFGIAKERRTTEVSMTPCVQGKPGYMSPEQQAGQRLDGRSDLYSVGVMLWELLAHERLFAGGVVAGQLDRPLPRPSVFRPVPRDLEAVAMKLLRRDRERRYRTAEAAYDAIARCDGSRPSTTRYRAAERANAVCSSTSSIRWDAGPCPGSCGSSSAPVHLQHPG